MHAAISKKYISYMFVRLILNEKFTHIKSFSGKQTKLCQLQIKYFGILNTRLCKRGIT